MTIFFLFESVVGAAGCSEKTSAPTPPSQEAGAPSDGKAADQQPDIDSQDDATFDSAPPDSHIDRGGDGIPICAADFPCRADYMFVCTGYDTYAAAENHDCHFTCGLGPCVGGTCSATGPNLTCPSGTRCLPFTMGKPMTIAGTPCARLDGGMDDSD
jgi:hypothetical protein